MYMSGALSTWQMEYDIGDMAMGFRTDSGSKSQLQKLAN